MRWLLPFLLVSCVSDPVPASCDAGGSPKATVCQACASDLDCAHGLACDHWAFVCKTPAQIQLPAGTWTCQADCDRVCGQAPCHLANGICLPGAASEV